MAYTKHTWVNESAPAINADHLNEMEDGIEIGVGKQDKITANGILKGNGSGTISAATAGTDYMKSMTISGSGDYISDITQSNGVVTATKANLPTASNTTLGMVKVDGTTITINNGTISSSGGGGTSGVTSIDSYTGAFITGNRLHTNNNVIDVNDAITLLGLEVTGSITNSGATLLGSSNSETYGPALPSTGTIGQIFFLLES